MKFPLNSLKFAQQTIELLTNQCMFARLIERIPAQCQRASRVSKTFHVETRNLLLEAPWTQKHVFLGHKRIVKIQLRTVLSIHEQTRLANEKAGRTAFKQYRTNAVKARAKPDINKKQRSKEHTSELTSLMHIHK